MPQTGRLPVTSAIAPNGANSAPPPPWDINGVTAQNVTFEVDVEPVLDLLPELLSRPAPPYVRLLVLDIPDSPVGPYREAQLLISCRFMMLPRQYIAASIVTSEAAKAANLANWHYSSDVGEIDLKKDGSTFTSTVKHPSGLEIRVSSPEAQETGTAIIRYDPTVVVAAGEEGKPGLITISSDLNGISQAWLSVNTSVEYSGGDRNSPWLRLRSRNPITCTVAVQDMNLPEPKPVGGPVAMSAG